MSKNIVICCDGTGSKFGTHNTNVVRLFSVIEKDDPEKQIGYYDCGVGTLDDASLATKFLKWSERILQLAFGKGFQQNVMEAYRYLMNHYEEGDKVFLFGFSRGAYTVRVLSGLVHNCGLLGEGNAQLIPYAFELYSGKSMEKEANRFKLMAEFKKDFSTRDCHFHFVGLWDTVSSVGWIDNFQKFPNTTKLENVAIVRQGLAIDERRTFFSPEIISGRTHSIPDLDEVWFAGCHTDVGGGYKEKYSRLSKVALKWMLGEAFEKGLIVDEKRYRETILGEGKDYVKPDPNAETYESMRHVWYFPEILPKTVRSYSKKPHYSYLPLGKRRKIPKICKIHNTVYERKNYNPKNLPSKEEALIAETKPFMFSEE